MTKNNFINILKHLIWPRYCPICGKIAVDCCQECIESLPNPLPLFSLDTGSTYFFEENTGETPCFALSEHQDYSRELLLKLKYTGLKSVGEKMGRLMASYSPCIDADFIVPMPLHVNSKRGYNQTKLLSEGISDIFSIPILTNTLEWAPSAISQTSSSGKQRKSLPHDTMYVRKRLDGIRIILVDDVYTTGTTLRVAKYNIEKAGGVVVFAMVWTRKLFE